MFLTDKITDQILDILGFNEYWDKGGTTCDIGYRFIALNDEGNRGYRIWIVGEQEAGSYWGYEIEARPGHFATSDFDHIETLEDLINDIKIKCPVDQFKKFMDLITEKL